jgi:HK97 family phage prohead protease
MQVTVVMGPPGAGKSTYVQEQRKPGDAVVDFDVLAQALGSQTAHDAPPAVAKLTFAARQAAIARALDGLSGADDELPADVWVIAWDLSEETYKRWEGLGANFVLLDPGEETVMERLRAEGRPQSSIDAATDWYARRAKGQSMLKYKSAAIDLGAAEIDDGQFIGYASVFGNVDSYGDVVVKGAFAESLAEHGEQGAGIPCYWSHRMDDPTMNIGSTVSAIEDEHGLKVTVQLDTESATGAYVHRLIKQGRVKQMSFAYDILDAAEVKVDGEWAYELRKLRIHEVSVVPVGANQATELLAVKRGEPKTSVEPAGDDEQDDVEEPAEEPNSEEPETVNEEANAEAKAKRARALIKIALTSGATNRKDSE